MNNYKYYEQNGKVSNICPTCNSNKDIEAIIHKLVRVENPSKLRLNTKKAICGIGAPHWWCNKCKFKF